MPDLQQHISSLERLVGDKARSPLFARLASLYMEAGRPKDALRICDAGLAGFPFYATGHFVKGKALLALNMKSEARRELEFVHGWLPTNPTVAELLESLPVSDQDFLTSPPEPVAPPSSVAPPETIEVVSSPEESPQSPAPEADGMAMFSRPAEIEAAPVVEPEQENVFGLPAEAPAEQATLPQSPLESSEATFGPMEGFASFGGGETAETAESAASETIATDAISEDTYEAFAAQMRGELGPTGVRTLDDFLSSEPFQQDAPEVVQEQVPLSEPAGIGTFPAFPSEGATDLSDQVEPASQSTDTGEIEASTDPFAAFSGPSFTEPTTPEPTASPDEAPAFAFPDFSEPDVPVQSGEDAIAPQPATPEPGGEFLGPAIEEPSAPENKIEELAGKLQEAGRITPVIDFSTKISSDSTGEAAVNAGFVTPTLAEIYAKQGWFDDAITAYKTLARTRPAEKDKFEARMKELEAERDKS